MTKHSSIDSVTNDSSQNDARQKSLKLPSNHWQRLHAPLPICGYYKQAPEHFVVEEIIDFELAGTGEHSWIWLEKVEQNTAFVAEQLAKFSQVPLRNVGYAGRKDKYALTRQWFSVYHANKAIPDWSNWSLDGCKILKVTKHEKKLKTGALSANRFKLKIELLDSVNESVIKQRLNEIETRGVPNYFGQQRFGEMRASNGQIYLNGNLDMAARMIHGEEIRNRNKRSMAISALRSWLFNEIVSHRIDNGTIDKIVNGDALKLKGSRSFFIAEDNESEQNKIRLEQRDIEITAPLWGKGPLDCKGDAAEFETSVAQQYPNVSTTLESLLDKQERRSAILRPENMSYSLDGKWLTLSFSLVSGAFATSVLREIVDIMPCNGDNAISE